jgi:hypothetical protein
LAGEGSYLGEGLAPLSAGYSLFRVLASPFCKEGQEGELNIGEYAARGDEAPSHIFSPLSNKEYSERI